jgi:IS30 family transposase
LKRVRRRTAVAVENAILDLSASYQSATHTITFDNGKEVANHKNFTHQLQADVFFAHPYAAWERGTNENTNGLICRYFPKGSDFSAITDAQIYFVKELLNERPRKWLDIHAPAMVFSLYPSDCN